MQFNDQNFQQEVEQQKGLTLVDFFASWCNPCKLMAPIIEELIEEYKDKNVKIGKFNVEGNREIAGKYNIMGIPTTILFKDGKVIERIMGFQEKQVLEQLIDKNL